MVAKVDKNLGYGLATGTLFGFFLQRSRILRYEKQLGALRLRDFTIVKFMLSAIMTASLIYHWLRDRNEVNPRFGRTRLPANVIGGLTFGAGWGLLGYCPGTSAGAVGEGRWDALVGFLGMIFGAGLFAEIYPFFRDRVFKWFDFGMFTLPDTFNLSPWQILPVLFGAILGLFGWLEGKGL